MELVGAVDIPRHLRALIDRAQPTQTSPGDWYRLSNASGDDDTDAELTIYSTIGGWYDSVTATGFAQALATVTAKNLTVRLNSPGGSVFEGITIANLIRSHPANVTVVVDGIAASIASVIAMAGDTIIMQPQSQMMIHDALGALYGNQADMIEMADLLNRQSDNIARAYATRAGGRYDTWRGRMKAETWYMADEAVAAGLADKVAKYDRPAGTQTPDTGETDAVEETEDLAAQVKPWDLSIYRYAGREQAPAPDTAEIAAQAASESDDAETGIDDAPANLQPARPATGGEFIHDTTCPETTGIVADGARCQCIHNRAPAVWADDDGLTTVSAGAVKITINAAATTTQIAAEIGASIDAAFRAMAARRGEVYEPAEQAPDTTADDGDDWAAAAARLTSSSADGWADATAHLITEGA